MAFSYKTVHLSEDPCYTLDRSGLIENPYIPAIRTRFVQPGKIEIDANERAVIGNRNAAFSFAPSSILSLTIFQEDNFGKEKPDAAAIYIRHEVFERVPPSNSKGREEKQNP